MSFKYNIQTLNLIKSSDLFKNSGVYIISNIINSAIPFFLLPILTNYLSPEDYGRVTMFNVVIGFFTPLIVLNINGAVERIYFEQDFFDFKTYVGTSFIVLTSSTFVISLLFLIFNKILVNITQLPIEILFTSIIFIFFNYFLAIVLNIMQVNKKPVKYGFLLVFASLLNSILSIIFIVSFSLSWQGRIYAQVVSIVLFGIISIYILFKIKIKFFKYNKKYLNNMLKFGIPLIPHALAGFLFTFLDKIFITNLVSLNETGLYSLGNSFGIIINILTTSFKLAFVPWLYSQLNKNEYKIKRRIVKITYFYFISIIFITLILSFGSHIFIRLFIDENFQKSINFVLWISLGYAFNGMYLMVCNYIFYAKKTASLSLVTIITAFIYVFLSYSLISIFGSIGAAYATTIIFLIKFVFTWKISNKIYKMPWRLKALTN
jgi:O-antigen/teichoic acid export membrane protein